MAALDISTLPLLPLNRGVVLPGMVVTLALETPEATAAVEAAQSADGLVVVVPRLSGPAGADGDGSTESGRFARVGTVARLESSGELPGGVHAVVVRGLHRATIGSGMAGTGRRSVGVPRTGRPRPVATPTGRPSWPGSIAWSWRASSSDGVRAASPSSCMA